MPKNRLVDLRDHLFETLEALRDDDNKLDDEVRRARAVCDVSKAIIESAKVEVNYAKACNADVGTEFFDGVATRPVLPSQTRRGESLQRALTAPKPAPTEPAAPTLQIRTTSDRERAMKATLNNPIYCADCLDAGHQCIATCKDEDGRPVCVFCLDGEPCVVEQRREQNAADREAAAVNA